MEMLLGICMCLTIPSLAAELFPRDVDLCPAGVDLCPRVLTCVLLVLLFSMVADLYPGGPDLHSGTLWVSRMGGESGNVRLPPCRQQGQEGGLNWALPGQSLLLRTEDSVMLYGGISVPYRGHRLYPPPRPS